jgi:hypothetical protein
MIVPEPINFRESFRPRFVFISSFELITKKYFQPELSDLFERLAMDWLEGWFLSQRVDFGLDPLDSHSPRDGHIFVDTAFRPAFVGQWIDRRWLRHCASLNDKDKHYQKKNRTFTACF